MTRPAWLRAVARIADRARSNRPHRGLQRSSGESRGSTAAARIGLHGRRSQSIVPARFWIGYAQACSLVEMPWEVRSLHKSRVMRLYERHDISMLRRPRLSLSGHDPFNAQRPFKAIHSLSPQPEVVSLTRMIRAWLLPTLAPNPQNSGVCEIHAALPIKPIKAFYNIVRLTGSNHAASSSHDSGTVLAGDQC